MNGGAEYFHRSVILSLPYLLLAPITNFLILTVRRKSKEEIQLDEARAEVSRLKAIVNFLFHQLTERGDPSGYSEPHWDYGSNYQRFPTKCFDPGSDGEDEDEEEEGEEGEEDGTGASTYPSFRFR